MKYYAGIDLGGTFIKCGIVSESGEIITKDQIPTGKDRPYEEIAADMAKFVKELESKCNVRIEAVGIGSPGTIDSEHGTIVYSNNIKWEKVPLAPTLQKMLSLPVVITNDANAAALGEAFCGAGKKYKDSVFITLGTGVGGGVIIDGKLFEGGRSAGTELGHTTIRMNGEKCSCGRKGCWEAYASATALIRQAKDALSKDTKKKSAMWALCDNDLEKLMGKTVTDAVLANDAIAKRVWNKYIGYVAEGIVNQVNVFRPQAVLIGGGVSKAGALLLTPLRRKVNKYIYGGTKYAPVKIEIASLENDAGLCGAAKLAIDRT